MTHEEAVTFLAPAEPRAGRWADAGAGTGTFTRALAELTGTGSVVYAIDRDDGAVASLRRLAARTEPGAARVLPVQGDLRDLPGIEELANVRLDGVLFANALHFNRRPSEVLARAVSRLGEHAKVVVIEYDNRWPNPWVPHPLPLDRLREAAAEAGLGEPVEVSRRASRYHREMYCAVIDVRSAPVGS